MFSVVNILIWRHLPSFNIPRKFSPYFSIFLKANLFIYISAVAHSPAPPSHSSSSHASSPLPPSGWFYLPPQQASLLPGASGLWRIRHISHWGQTQQTSAIYMCQQYIHEQAHVCCLVDDSISGTSLRCRTIETSGIHKGSPFPSASFGFVLRF